MHEALPRVMQLVINDGKVDHGAAMQPNEAGELGFVGKQLVRGSSCVQLLNNAHNNGCMKLDQAVLLARPAAKFISKALVQETGDHDVQI